MAKKTTFYFLIILSTVLSGYFLFMKIETLTYKVVLVFIALIILSNAFAKLYANLILKVDL